MLPRQNESTKQASPGATTKGRRPRKIRDEASNSFALFIIMAPVIFGAFGTGLDVSRNVWIRTQLQNALDLAVVGGAGTSNVASNGEVVIAEADALDNVEKIYALNRSSGPPLSCWGDRSNIPDTAESRCWRVLERDVRSQYLYYSISERSKNAFLPVIGIKWQEYTVTSEARIKQAAE